MIPKYDATIWLLVVNGYPTVLNIILHDWEVSLVSRSRYVTINAFWHSLPHVYTLWFQNVKMIFTKISLD